MDIWKENVNLIQGEWSKTYKRILQRIASVITTMQSKWKEKSQVEKV